MDLTTREAAGRLRVSQARVRALAAAGTLATVLFEDVDPTERDRVAAAHAHGRLTWDDISRSRGSRVSNPTSVAFGGPDLKMLYLAGFGVEQVQVLRSPVAGIPLEHWGEA